MEKTIVTRATYTLPFAILLLATACGGTENSANTADSLAARRPSADADRARDDFPVCGRDEPNCNGGALCCRNALTGAVICVSCAPQCDGPNPAEASCASDRECRDGAQCVTASVCQPSSCFCDPATAQWICTDDCAGRCERPCGGIAGLECRDDEVCRLPAGSCHIQDAMGVCVPRPEACTEEYAPVCGCDGVTYSNACHALAAGATIDHRGECRPTCEPVACRLYCENGFKTDANGCEICECNDRCEPVACDLYCENGFKTNADGCEICECNNRCEALACDLACPRGFQLADDGCEVCACR